MSKENSKRIAQYNMDHITDTAMELFFSNGIKGTSVEDIAKHGDISRMTIYKYFPSKADIVVSVFDRYLIHGSPCVKQKLFSEDYESLSGFEQIRRQLFIYAELHMENPAVLPFLSEVNVLMRENEYVRETKKKNCLPYNSFNEFYFNAVQKGLRDGSISKRAEFEENDYLFVRKIMEGVYLKCYLFFGREHFFIHQKVVYEKLVFAADKISVAFFKPEGCA